MDSPNHNENSGRAESVALKIFASIIIVMAVLIAIKCLRRLADGPPPPPRGVSRASTMMMTASLDSSMSTAVVAPSSIVTSLPTFVYAAKSSEEKLECAVCLTEFEEGEEGRVLPSCCHKFHTECVTQWFQSNSTCPLCRSSVELPV